MNRTTYGTTAYSASGCDKEYIRDLCPGWKFGGQGLPADEAAAPGYDDSGWETVSIPHTWNACDAEDGDGTYKRTACWYRKPLEWDACFAGRKVYVEFLGANQKTDVYCNGRHIPCNGTANYTHKGGYTVFRYDLTDALTSGANLLAVRVDNTNGIL